MIVGGGTIAYYLARRLLEVGIHTKIIDQDPARCEHLSELLPKASIICGDGTDERLLIQEGSENVDAFAALTGLDEENIPPVTVCETDFPRKGSHQDQPYQLQWCLK